MTSISIADGESKIITLKPTISMEMLKPIVPLEATFDDTLTISLVPEVPMIATFEDVNFQK